MSFYKKYIKFSADNPKETNILYLFIRSEIAKEGNRLLPVLKELPTNPSTIKVFKEAYANQSPQIQSDLMIDLINEIFKSPNLEGTEKKKIANTEGFFDFALTYFKTHLYPVTD